MGAESWSGQQADPLCLTKQIVTCLANRTVVSCLLISLTAMIPRFHASSRCTEAARVRLPDGENFFCFAFCLFSVAFFSPPNLREAAQPGET